MSADPTNWNKGTGSPNQTAPSNKDITGANNNKGAAFDTFMSFIPQYHVKT